jgi:hypothetical protein
MASIAVSAAAGDPGVTPRPNSSDYPAHQDAKTATIAAALVKPDQARKIFSSDFSKKCLVVEVAVYPRDGAATKIDFFDFALKLSTGERIHAARTQEVARVWREKDIQLPGRRVEVVSEVGVVYTSGGGSNERSRGWGRYGGVGDSGAQTPPTAPPSPPSDQDAVGSKIHEKALPEGKTSSAVAGYLYFRLASKSISGVSIRLEHLEDGDIISVPLLFK